MQQAKHINLKPLLQCNLIFRVISLCTFRWISNKTLGLVFQLKYRDKHCITRLRNNVLNIQIYFEQYFKIDAFLTLCLILALFLWNPVLILFFFLWHPRKLNFGRHELGTELLGLASLVTALMWTLQARLKRTKRVLFRDHF